MKAFKLTVIACSLAVCAGCTMAPKYERPAGRGNFPDGGSVQGCDDHSLSAPRLEGLHHQPESQESG